MNHRVSNVLQARSRFSEAIIHVNTLEQKLEVLRKEVCFLTNDGWNVTAEAVRKVNTDSLTWRRHAFCTTRRTALCNAGFEEDRPVLFEAEAALGHAPRSHGTETRGIERSVCRAMTARRDMRQRMREVGGVSGHLKCRWHSAERWKGLEL